MDKNTKTWGGPRQGAGAKSRYKEPTKSVAFRCPVSKVAEFKIKVTEILDDWKNKE